MFAKLHNDVKAAIKGRLDVSEIVKEEEYYVFGIFGKHDYLIVALDGNTVDINNCDDRIKRQYNIGDKNLADTIVKTICELNCILL